MIYTVLSIIDNHVCHMQHFKYAEDALHDVSKEIDKMRDVFNEEDEAADNEEVLENIKQYGYGELYFNNNNASIVVDYLMIN